MSAPGGGRTAAEPVLELGGGLPGWSLRVLVFAAGAAAALVQGVDAAGPVILVALIALAAVCATVPGMPASALLIASVAVLVTATGGDPLRATVLAEVPLLHLVHVSTALAAVVPARARVHPRALLAPARRFLQVQLVTFAVAGLVLLLPTGGNLTVVEVAGPLAATGLVLLAARLFRRPR